MFTGLIRDFGKVVSFENEILSVRSKLQPQIGDSIAINGACLTVIKIKNDIFSVELSHESRKILAHENLKNQVHLEPAMRLSDRFDGHMVQGHIDAVGKVADIKKDENGYDFFIDLQEQIMPYMIQKGSICVDGVSLTINEVFKKGVRLTIIPHTFENTLFDEYKKGRRVNIESDLFARYVYNILHPKRELTWDDVDRMMSSY